MALKLYYLMGVLIIAHARAKQKYKMPEPLHPGYAVSGTDLRKYRYPSSSKLVDNDETEWEKSGLFEGDIVISSYRNNAIDRPGAKWPMPIPVCISDEDFDEEDVSKIKKGLSEIQAKTCITFRQCREADPHFVMVKGNSTGCWSLVGRHDGGQILHLQPEGCLKHGIIIHEFLHVLGFYHQHSVPDRDEFVNIHWMNIKESKKGNFRKYKHEDTAWLDVIYDYDSVMHYSKKAFSKNRQPTITPKNSSATIGQRYYMSKNDIYKVNSYYSCDSNHIGNKEDDIESIIDEMDEAFDFIY